MSMRFVGGVAACSAAVALATSMATAQGTVAAGSVVGKITYDGKAPRPRVIRMSSDPLCMTEKGGSTSEVLLVGPGSGLQNAFVYVKDGLAGKTFPAPKTPIVLDQQGCRYSPHVIGIQVGQPLEIRNSDPLLHNVHAEGAINRPFDVGQPLQGIKTTHTFTTREVMIPVKCQVHAWMRGYIGVLEHPFFAVTDADGRFSIPQLPPGTYTVEAWHERLGTQTQQITVAPKDAKTLDFTFKAS